MNPERWLVLTAGVQSADLLDLVGAELIGLGGSSVVVDSRGVSTYLAAPGDPGALIGAARERIAAALPEGTAFTLESRWQDNEDWARDWKRGLKARQVTDRIVVKPTWTDWEAAPGAVIIEIDPEMAFGTGEHATTRGCLRLLDGAVKSGDRVLDVGSGSAILAIAAALLGAREVVAVEYDPDANLNARDNLTRNGVAGRVEILEEMADPALLETLGAFDLVTANILSGVIRPLLPTFHRTLTRGGKPGRLIVSGILQTEAEEMREAATTTGFRVEREDREDEWWSALLTPILERSEAS